jgi:hypothetical protein
MTTEVWKQPSSLPEYEASSLGRIRRVPYIGKMPYGGARQYGGHAWTGTWAKGSGGGRYIFRFRGKNYKVAIIVCEAFHGPKPFKEARCLHIDENSRNNTPTNLKWGTQKENLNAPGFIAYCKARTGEDSPTTKGRKIRNQ